MSQEVKIGARRFFIVSEPEDGGWKAQVLEIIDDKGSTQDIGIETTGETRGVADERALGVLQHRLREGLFWGLPPFPVGAPGQAFDASSRPGGEQVR